MKPLETYRRCFIWLSIHPADEPSNNRQKAAYTAFTMFNLILQLIMFVGCLVFCWKFFSIDLEKCMFAFMACAATLGSIYMAIIAITIMPHKIAAIFYDLSIIYNSSKCCLCFKLH